jgi:predicted nucleic acid-binding Zn ribbon protein
MQKINALLNQTKSESSNQLHRLVAQTEAHLVLQQFWQATAPLAIGQFSNANSLNNGLLTVYAQNSAVATKIKLTSASLLTQLQNLQKEDSLYKQCKVTGIKVKVQVKSEQKRAKPRPRKISTDAAGTLRKLALTLGDSKLANKLNQLADNAKT